ncbi:hypothetical protein INR49_030463 [Caranx melampygus]|nr:hypothetical protein INR49_030463 [Caranx melampygus]
MNLNVSDPLTDFDNHHTLLSTTSRYQQNYSVPTSSRSCVTVHLNKHQFAPTEFMWRRPCEQSGSAFRRVSMQLPGLNVSPPLSRVSLGMMVLTLVPPTLSP